MMMEASSAAAAKSTVPQKDLANAIRALSMDAAEAANSGHPYPDLPVVMMTAYGTLETAVASMKEGALDYLTKPIDLDELLLIFQPK